LGDICARWHRLRDRPVPQVSGCDSAMALNPPFHHDNDEERLCLACMRHDLKIFRRRRSRRLTAQLALLRSRRESETPPTFEDVELRLQRSRDYLASHRSQPA